MAKTQSSKIDKTLVGWSKKMSSLGFNDIANKYNDTDFLTDFHLVRKLELPTYDGYLIPVIQFLNDFHHQNDVGLSQGIWCLPSQASTPGWN